MKPQAILEVGIIGAGTMGAGIAMCFANAGIKTTLVDISRESLDRGLAKIASEYTASFKKGKIDARTRAARIGLITGATTIHAIAHCDLVIEAVFEDLQLKTSVCQEMGAICRTGAILASNTSALNLDTLAQASGRPESVVGLHFFSPANVMRLLEVVRGSASTPAVSTRIQFTVPGNGIVNFGTGGNTYEILAASATNIHLRNIGIDGKAWYQNLKVKP